MTSALVPFAAEHLPALSDFSKQLWERPESSDYFTWRYLECPKQTGLVALRGTCCVATLWAVKRDYVVGGQRTTLLEPFDWYVRPKLIDSGTGVRVMRSLMTHPEPMIIVGGTDYTRRFLPRLGWRVSGVTRSYVLPLSSRALTPRIEQGVRLPRFLAHAAAGLLTRVWCRPQRHSPPFAASVQTVDRLDDETLALYDGPLGYAAVPVPDPNWHAWLSSGAPGAGRFVLLEYRRERAVIGWALGRVYATTHGLEAAVVDIFTPQPQIEIYRWMVSVLVERLLEYRPMEIRARASCRVLGQALKQNRFLPGPTTPIFLWAAQPFELPHPLHLTGDTADNAVIPYETPSLEVARARAGSGVT